MREDQIDQAERRETLDNDQLVREAEHRRILREGTTFHQFAQSTANDEAGGRFAQVNATTVVGAPAVKYPQLPSSSPWSGAQPEPGIEPPTGYRIDEMTPLEPSAVYSPVEVGAPVLEAPPSGVQATMSPADDVETGTGAPLFSSTEESK